MNLIPQNPTRAYRLREKAWRMRVTHAEIARQLGKSRSWVSQVLNEHEESEPLLDRIEEYLDEKAGEFSLAA